MRMNDEEFETFIRIVEKFTAGLFILLAFVIIILSGWLMNKGIEASTRNNLSSILYLASGICGWFYGFYFLVDTIVGEENGSS